MAATVKKALKNSAVSTDQKTSKRKEKKAEVHQGYYYSPGDQSFYIPSVHGSNMPTDAHPVTDAEYRKIRTAHTKGHLIRTGDDGKATTVAPEATLDDIRAHRNHLLAQSDWTQVADGPVDQDAWRAYRKKLRDITENLQSPDRVVWPKAPKG